MDYIFVGQNILGGSTLKGLVDNGYLPLLVITREENNYPNLVLEQSVQNKLPVKLVSNINRDKELVKKIVGLQAEVVFCCSWGDLIREPLLSTPKLGWINFHPSYLPAYRGPRPIEWQLINGERYGGCTAHFMTKRFDEGPIILQEKIEIDFKDNGETMRVKCGQVMGHLATQCMKLLIDNPSFSGVKQDEAHASYAPPREHIREINWWRPAIQIYNQVRGLSPFPCAIFWLKGFELQVAELELTNIPCSSSPRQTIQDGEGKLLVATADYYVKLISLRIGDKIISNYARYIKELGIACEKC